MTPYEKDLNAALSPETPPKPDELKAALLAVYAKFELFNGTVHQRPGCISIWTACWRPS